MWKASISKKIYFDSNDFEVAGPSVPPSEDPPAGSPAPPTRPSLLPEEISSSETAEEDPPLKRRRRNRRRTPPLIISDANSPSKAFPLSEKDTPRGSSPSQHPSPIHLPTADADPDLLLISSEPVPATLEDPPELLRDTSEEELQGPSLSTVCDLLGVILTQGLAHQREIAKRLPGVACNYQEIQRLNQEHAAQLHIKDLEMHNLTTRLQASSLELHNANTELSHLRESHKLQMERHQQELEALKKSSEQHAQESSQQIAILKTEESTLREKLDAAQGELAAYHLSEAGRWATRQQEYLSSPEFNNLLEDRAAHFLQWGFIGAVKQIKEANCIPPGTSLDFLDIQKALADMPDNAL